jgi:hypothetical protein
MKRAYISSDGRFTPRPRLKRYSGRVVIQGTPARLYIQAAGTTEPPTEADMIGFSTEIKWSDIPPLGSIVSADNLETLRQSLEWLDKATRASSPVLGGPWYLAWSNPTTGKEGRTWGPGWPTREAVESAADAWRSTYPDRHWWPVHE